MPSSRHPEIRASRDQGLRASNLRRGRKARPREPADAAVLTSEPTAGGYFRIVLAEEPSSGPGGR
jgi:hypothetical protein